MLSDNIVSIFRLAMMIPSEPPVQPPPATAANGHFTELPAVLQQAEQMVRSQLLSQLPRGQVNPSQQLAHLNPHQIRILQNIQEFSKKVSACAVHALD